MVISPLMLLLIILVVLAFSGWGYGYYSGGAYANPVGLLGAVLLVLLLLWLLSGWPGPFGPPVP